LRAEAGEIANAIELILAGATSVLPGEFQTARLRQWLTLRMKQLLIHICRLRTA
jgi:hypothetical protein